MPEIPTKYNPKEVEDRWYNFWLERGYFKANPNPDKKPYCIVIPPPNITGILHMGHALNDTIQDILIRFKRMQGFETLWLPGTDHAGIATQNVVERELMKEGLKRQDLGREKFLEKVWEWRERYGNTIIHQLKKLGCSCDWERTRFTMDEGLSDAVLEVFVRLYEGGLIYQGDYIINWCPRCRTALSDEEAQHKDINGSLYYIKYPIKDDSSEHIVVATTRPETMLGDTAVAVNPGDKRYKHLVGKSVILPIVNRELKIVADEMVDPKFGTGIVKITPAHDPNDYALGKKHNLEFINVMNPDGTMNENANDYRGMDRFECREAILDDLKERDLLLKIEPHAHAVGHCYRCHTMVEPYLSRQWFVKMKPLAEPAIDAVKKKRIKFHPARWTKVYLSWMENIRDWCISRQIWWGHRLPVYYCKKCQQQANESTVHSEQLTEKGKIVNPGIIVAKTRPEKCPVCGGTEIAQDEDVLDTWFSSWLWPFSTLGWPGVRKSGTKKSNTPMTDLDYFYPTSSLVTGYEIIFFWVARMIMAGFEFVGDIPFEDVYIHGIVRDVTGMKMSKSLGNVIDPLVVIDEYGTDALRFSIISITSLGQDVFLSKEKFEVGRNFANKIWNASRFVMMNTASPSAGGSAGSPRPEPSRAKSRDSAKIDDKNLSLADRWILSRLNRTIDSVTKSYEKYRFNEAASTLYEFFWHEFCDWYVELVKPVLVQSPSTGSGSLDEGSRAKSRDSESRVKSEEEKMSQAVIAHVLETSLRLLHPTMPFITEEIWQRLKEVFSVQCPVISEQGTAGSIMVARWPKADKARIDADAERQMKLVMDSIAAIRNIRAEMSVPLNRKCTAVFAGKEKTTKVIAGGAQYIANLAGVEKIEFTGKTARPHACASALVDELEVFIPLSGLIDLEAEKKRLQSRIDQASRELEQTLARIENKEFLKKAPAEVVKKEKEKSAALTESLEKLKTNLRQIA